jgi:MFS family permease
MKKTAQKIFQSLRIRNYRLYFIGQAISLSGTWMQTIGQDWLVLKITHSGLQLGIVSAFQFLPLLLLGPFGGVIADRFDKRKILLITQSIAGFLALILGILVATGTVQIWMVYILALCFGLTNTVDSPTRQTFVAEMVGKERLRNAVTLNSTEVNLARAVGPAISGILIASLDLALCFFLNAISYIAVLISLLMMRKEDLHPAPRTERTKGQLMEGLWYVRRSPVLRNTLIMMAIIGTFSYEFSVSLPLFAQFTFHGNAGSYAALVTSMGVGSVVGGLFSASREKIAPHMLIYSSLFFGVMLTVSSLMPNIYLAMGAMFLVGIFSINFISLGNATLQIESEPQMRGRVMSLWSMAFMGSTPIGGPIIGYIGETLGPRFSLAVGGIAAVVAAGVGLHMVLQKDRLQKLSPTIKAISNEIAAEEKS